MLHEVLVEDSSEGRLVASVEDVDGALPRTMVVPVTDAAARSEPGSVAGSEGWEVFALVLDETADGVDGVYRRAFHVVPSDADRQGEVVRR